MALDIGYIYFSFPVPSYLSFNSLRVMFAFGRRHKKSKSRGIRAFSKEMKKPHIVNLVRS